MEKQIDLYDIYDFYYTPWHQTLWFKIVTGLLIVITLGALIFLLMRKRKKVLSPWEYAFKELDKLSLNKCSKQDDYKKFYFGMSRILKTYLHQKFNWNTENKTDDELIAWLKEQKINPDLITMLGTLSSSAIWIKFANVTALKTQAEADLKTVIMIIERTRMDNTNT